MTTKLSVFEVNAIAGGVKCSKVYMSRSGKAVHFVPCDDKRSNTVKYALYHDENGYFFRRMIDIWHGWTRFYQLFRTCNPYTYEANWEHFNTIEEAIDRFNNYLVKINA